MKGAKNWALIIVSTCALTGLSAGLFAICISAARTGALA
jgi:hypothetical protein